MSNYVRQIQRAQDVRDWETERQVRVDGYAAVLTHCNAALAALPGGDDSAKQFAGELRWAVHNARGRMSAIFQEPNPYVRTEKS